MSSARSAVDCCSAASCSVTSSVDGVCTWLDASACGDCWQVVRDTASATERHTATAACLTCSFATSISMSSHRARSSASVSRLCVTPSCASAMCSVTSDLFAFVARQSFTYDVSALAATVLGATAEPRVSSTTRHTAGAGAGTHPSMRSTAAAMSAMSLHSALIASEESCALPAASTDSLSRCTARVMASLSAFNSKADRSSCTRQSLTPGRHQHLRR